MSKVKIFPFIFWKDIDITGLRKKRMGTENKRAGFVGVLMGVTVFPNRVSGSDEVVCWLGFFLPFQVTGE